MITKLGSKQTVYPKHPNASILETFENKDSSAIFLVPFCQERDEFSSLCVVGDTKIDIAVNEIDHPKGIPIRDLVGTEGVVFGFDIDSNSPVARRYHFVRRTQSQSVVVKVTMDHISGDGSGHISKIKKELILTPDHLVLVSDGWYKFKWVKACRLEPGMRLIADQRSQDSIRGKARHRLIGDCLLGRKLTSREDIHHKDGNHFNNNPENIEIKLRSQHRRDHQTVRYGYSDVFPCLEELVELYNQGENFSSLAKKYKCDQSTIYSRIGSLVKKRTHSEDLLIKPESINLHKTMLECKQYYDSGYTTVELSEFYNVDATTISSWIVKSGGRPRTTLETKEMRKDIRLVALNHRIISVEDFGRQDVYNMEVEDIQNFFGNGVVLHNCPVTGQPDVARMEILYVPIINMVESKSLKLYFFSFRNEGAFHESIVSRICNDLWSVLSPRYLRVFGDFAPRGGISIKPLIEEWDVSQGADVRSEISRLVTCWDLKRGKV
jgi:7-cyano-7-deazaguanine reductase